MEQKQEQPVMSEKLQTFFITLQELYQAKRAALEGKTDKELFNPEENFLNEDFRVIFIITNAVFGALTSQSDLEEFEKFVEELDYNIDLFLNKFDVIAEKHEGKDIPVVILKAAKDEAKNTES